MAATWAVKMFTRLQYSQFQSLMFLIYTRYTYDTSLSDAAGIDSIQHHILLEIEGLNQCEQ